MRKALFALVMVAAAFAGGALVNGPGLTMLQSLGRVLVRNSDFVRVVSSPTSAPSAPAASTPLPSGGVAPAVATPDRHSRDDSTALAGADTPSAGGHNAQREVPSAPLPPLFLNRSDEPGKPKDSGPTKEFVANSNPGGTGSREAAEAPKPPAALPLSSIEVPAPLPTPPSQTTSVDNLSKAMDQVGGRPVGAPAPSEPAPSATRDPQVTRAEMLKESGIRGSSQPAKSTDTGSLASTAVDWASLRRRMQELGVSRYEMEVELSGRVRFRCLIPLAGRRAVGQMFEGEGDDESQAAKSALKRIQLWKVSGGLAPK